MIYRFDVNIRIYIYIVRGRVYSVSTIVAVWFNERVVVVCDVSDDFVCLIERQTRCSYARKADEIIIEKMYIK